MSTQNHPNFHAVKFTTDIVNSFYGSLRGKAVTSKMKNREKVGQAIENFVAEIEEMVDKAVEGEN